MMECVDIPELAPLAQLAAELLTDAGFTAGGMERWSADGRRTV